MNDFKHLDTVTDDEGYLWVALKAQDRDFNVLHQSVIEELNILITAAENTTNGIAFQALPTQDGLDCIDLAEMVYLNNTAKTHEIIQNGQQLCQKLEKLTIPTITLIDDQCVQYGLELAMATDYCIASNSPTLQICFPETSLGLHPIMGCAQRAIKRAGLKAAMSYLLSGETLSAKQALEIGLIDACVPKEHLRTTALDWLKRAPQPHQPNLTTKLQSLPLLRHLTALPLTKYAHKQGKPDQAPAAYALIDLWKKFGTRTDTIAQKAFAESAVKLSTTHQSRNRIRVTHLKYRLCSASIRHRSAIQQAHIIGTSPTACDIITWFIQQNIKVTVQDKTDEAINRALQNVRSNLALLPGQKELDTAMSLFQIDKKGNGATSADLILVSQANDLTNIHEIFADLEERSKPDAILATQSATLPLDKISAALLKPERVIGIHFCYPAYQTPLVEVSYTSKTDQAIVQQAQAMLCGLNKLPLLMRNHPGLLVDRILVQYILQGIRLHQQGVPQLIIDKVARDFGMPHGPLELGDQVGLDYCLRLAEVLEKAFNIEIPFTLIDMIKTGKLGIKSGNGFYRYRNGNRLKPERVDWSGSENALQEKLITPILEEAALCLEDGVVEDPDLIDAGVVFGLGFAPFRGGPLFYQRTRGKQLKQVVT